MKRSIIVSVLCLLTLCATAGLAQTRTAVSTPEADNPTIAFKQLMAELKRLRLEVLQQGIEFQQWKIKQIESELQPMQREQDHLTQQETAIRQQIAEIDQHAASSTPTGTAPGSEIETIKTELAEKGLPAIHSKREPITERVSELTRQLNQEEARLYDLLNKAKKLRTED